MTLRVPTFTLLLIMASACAGAAWAQTPPSSTAVDAYTGLLAAAAAGDVAALRAGLDYGANPDVHDAYGRTPLHVAAYAGKHEVMRLLVAAGADPNALENDRYDIVTIAAVANDVPTLEVALAPPISGRFPRRGGMKTRFPGGSRRRLSRGFHEYSQTESRRLPWRQP